MKIFLNVISKIAFIYPVILLLCLYNVDLSAYKFVILPNIFFSVFIIFMSSLIKRDSVSIAVETFGAFLMNVVLFCDILYFYLFKTKITLSTFFIVFETNSEESAEFISMYLDSTIVVFILTQLLGIGLSLFLSIYLSGRNSRYRLIWQKKFLGLQLHYFAIIITVGLFIHFIRSFLFIVYINAYIAYNKHMEISYDKMGGEFSQVLHTSASEKETYVLIIGESTTNHHMSLYGYSRKTNPLLENFNDTLYVYKNVIAPHTHTIPALLKILTPQTHQNPEKIKTGSLIQLFNKAGFKTFWLSNQAPLGKFETTITSLSRTCFNRAFINVLKNNLDNALLEPFQEIVNLEFDKKLIILHLCGTHFEYSKRYSKEFDKFKDTPQTIIHNEEAFKTINEYDNSILYNDYVISNIFSVLQKESHQTAAIYLSDHGEEVYETIDFTGHHLEENGTSAMYDIPFIIWLSDTYRQTGHTIEIDTSRKYNTEDLLHTLADLSNIRFHQFDSTKSILSPYFIEKDRYIGKNKTYEDTFGNGK